MEDRELVRLRRHRPFLSADLISGPPASSGTMAGQGYFMPTPISTSQGES